MSPPVQPQSVVPFPNREIGIRWSDGTESFHDSFELRCNCNCAHCVDETTGNRLLVREDIPKDVRMVQAHPVGNYGLGIVWSDGHDTGIYTFERLRAAAGLS